MAEKSGVAHFFRPNLSLSLFSLGRIQERSLGFMRVLDWEFDLNFDCHA